LGDILLARDAEALFWLARYVERAENLARILDVNATFARNSRGDQNWLPVLQLNRDQDRFFAIHPILTAEAVLQFYVTDRENPTSIASAMERAHENARALRPIIPSEMWAQLNVFRKWLHGLDEAALAPAGLARLFGRIKEACQTHAGITEGTLHRDQGSYFYRLGRAVERADQTTRLLDIKYHLLLPRVSDVGSSVDVVQWSALLRSAAAHHAYLRVVPGGVSPAGVAGFLLLHPRFPRSVAFCIGEAVRLLAVLRSRHGLTTGAGAEAELEQLQASLGTLTIEEILQQGLHEFLDRIQLRLITATGNLAEGFFNPSSGGVQAQASTGHPR
jgi:uncharacterized alpha-E superfamily protein